MSLIKHLQTIRDFRTQPDYPLWVVLWLVVMGTMRGCTGYRPLADFVFCPPSELLTELDLPRQRLPSLSTLRRIRVRVDFVSLLCLVTQGLRRVAHDIPGLFSFLQ